MTGLFNQYIVTGSNWALDVYKSLNVRDNVSKQRRNK